MTDNSIQDTPLFLQSSFPPPSAATMSALNETAKPLPPQAEPTFHSAYPSDLLRKWHQHTISGSTVDSTDSSPTTTISADESSGAESSPSPSSSPESPPPTSYSLGMLRPRTSGDERPFFELQKQPPPRKGRNLKNLAVNTSRQPGRPGPTTAGLTLPSMNAPNISNGSTTTFVKPPTPSKRKTNTLGLTLLTPGLNANASHDAAPAIPPTPSFTRPALRHFQSSPTLPLVSINGCRPRPTLFQIPSGLDTIVSPIDPPSPKAEEEEQNFDVPLSREEKPQAYPDGPICVYEPYIDLYLEPTAEQAREYDLIMNVASEVRNPLLSEVPIPVDENEIRLDGGGGIQYAPRRPGTSGPKVGRSREHSPSTTPKATPRKDTFFGERSLSSKRDPEYMHIPWEHNSDIVPDLLRLCKLIDEKINEQKRILIHCQCGVSRSASLVVAYGIYKNPTGTVQDAYDAVKKKSKWIGPNMNLIMQLQEYRTSLLRGGLSENRGRASPNTPGSALSEFGYPFAANFAASPTTSSVGMGSPLSQSITVDALPTLTPGPASAPLNQPWMVEQNVTSTSRPRAVSAVKPASAYVHPSGKVLSITPIASALVPSTIETTPIARLPASRELDIDETDAPTPTATLMSPRGEHFAMTPLQPTAEIQSADRFGLMSPTSTSFVPSDPEPPLMSPRSEEFGMIGLQAASRMQSDDRFRLMSPTKPAFFDSTPEEPLMSPRSEEFGMVGLQPPSGVQSDDEFGLMSPTKTEFFPAIADDPPMSPRSDEFAMISISPAPEVQSDDKFGLMSPTAADFGNPFDRSSILAQLGMGSVNSQAPPPFPRRSSSLRAPTTASPEPSPEPSLEPSAAAPVISHPPAKLRPRPKLRGKISSPTLREQQQLQSLQTQLAAQHSATADEAEDAVLLSPRATEFTKNPFALDLPPATAPVPPLPPLDPRMSFLGQSGVLPPLKKDAEVPKRPTTADPRSPAYKGGSPIVRNIFDVLWS